MVMTLSDYAAKFGKIAEVCTFTGQDGRDVNLAIEGLRDAIRTSGLKIELVPFDPNVMRFVMKTTRFAVVEAEIEKFAKPGLKRHPINKPVIFCVYHNGHRQLVEGAAAYGLAGLMHAKNVPAYICYPAMWEQFVITGPILSATPSSSDNSNPWKVN